MKFRYYITNLLAGCIQGTNSLEDAEAFAATDDAFVLDAETGEWVTTGERQPVQQIGQ